MDGVVQITRRIEAICYAAARCDAKSLVQLRSPQVRIDQKNPFAGGRHFSGKGDDGRGFTFEWQRGRDQKYQRRAPMPSQFQERSKNACDRLREGRISLAGSRE